MPDLSGQQIAFALDFKIGHPVPTEDDRRFNNTSSGGATGSAVGSTASVPDVGGRNATYSLTDDTSGTASGSVRSAGDITVAEGAKARPHDRGLPDGDNSRHGQQRPILDANLQDRRQRLACAGVLPRLRAGRPLVENNAYGAAVISASAIDANPSAPNDTITYDIISGPAARDGIHGAPMAAQVISLFSRVRPASRDWTQREIEGFYRVESALRQAGLDLESERGITDEGDPWFIFCRADTGEILLHFALENDHCVAEAGPFGRAARGDYFAEMVHGNSKRNCT